VVGISLQPLLKDEHLLTVLSYFFTMISKKKGIKRQRFIVVSCVSLLSLVLAAPATASLSTTATNIAPWLAAIGININPYIKDIKNLESFYAQNVNANIDDVIAGLQWNLGEMQGKRI